MVRTFPLGDNFLNRFLNAGALVQAEHQLKDLVYCYDLAAVQLNVAFNRNAHALQIKLLRPLQSSVFVTVSVYKPADNVYLILAVVGKHLLRVRR